MLGAAGIEGWSVSPSNDAASRPQEVVADYLKTKGLLHARGLLGEPPPCSWLQHSARPALQIWCLFVRAHGSCCPVCLYQPAGATHAGRGCRLQPAHCLCCRVWRAEAVCASKRTAQAGPPLQVAAARPAAPRAGGLHPGGQPCVESALYPRQVSGLGSVALAAAAAAYVLVSLPWRGWQHVGASPFGVGGWKRSPLPAMVCPLCHVPGIESCRTCAPLFAGRCSCTASCRRGRTRATWRAAGSCWWRGP